MARGPVTKEAQLLFLDPVRRSTLQQQDAALAGDIASGEVRFDLLAIAAWKLRSVCARFGISKVFLLVERTPSAVAICRKDIANFCSNLEVSGRGLPELSGALFSVVPQRAGLDYPAILHPSMIPGIDHVFLVQVYGSSSASQLLGALHARNVAVEVFDAFDAGSLRLETPVTSPFIKGGERLPPNRLGNFLSKVAIYREALRRGLNNVLILEEDCRLMPCFWENAADAVSQLPANVDMLYFGALDWKEADASPLSPLLYRPGRPVLQHAVFHRLEALTKLVDHTRNLRETMDIMVSQLYVDGGITATATRHRYAVQEAEKYKCKCGMVGG